MGFPPLNSHSHEICINFAIINILDSEQFNYVSYVTRHHQDLR